MNFPSGDATVDQQVEAVKTYALAKYENGGWDLVVETMTRGEIEDLIKGTKSRWGAIDRVRKAIAPVAAYRKEIESTAW